MVGLELMVMIVEKSSAYAPYDSYLFRVGFMMALAVVLLSSYTGKQWLVVAGVSLLTFIHYRLTGSNDLLRYAMFIFACRDYKPEKVIKFSFFVSLAGFLIIVLLSVLGVLGEISMTGDFGRSVGVETRFVFGFGHPNTFHGAFYSLLLMGLYLWEIKDPALAKNADDTAKRRAFAFFAACFVLNLILFAVTRSRTAAIIGGISVICMGFLHFADDGSDRIKKTVCGAGILIILADIGFSVWSAAVSKLTDDRNGFIFKLSRLLNDRILNLYYNTKKHKGSLQTWTLLGIGADRDKYFDMGWVRLYYWYGIIPGILVTLLVIALMIICVERGDMAAVVLIASLSVYTVIEATFVSRYVGRMFMLPIAGVYLMDIPALEGRECQLWGIFGWKEKTDT